MSRKYKFFDPQGIYFISFATVGWNDVFTRPLYKDIVVESLRHCQLKKGLLLYEWVIMSNHVHLLASAAPDHSLSDIMRDLKKFTSGTIHKAIKTNQQESRKDWMMDLLNAAGEANNHNTAFQLWQQHNHPLIVSTPKEFDRVVEYIRMNPVVEGIVADPSAYVYSSAHEPGKLSLEMM